MAYIDWWNRTGPITMGERFGLNEISTARKTLSPTKSYTEDRIDMKPGGIVEPGVTHYATSPKKTGKFKYKVVNQFGTFWSDQKPWHDRPTVPDFKKEAKALGIDIKGLDDEEIKQKVRDKRGGEVKKIKRLDPDFAAKEAAIRKAWQKENPEKVKEYMSKWRQKEYLKKGIPPSAKNAKEELWRSLFLDAQRYEKGRRLKIIGDYGKYISRDQMFDAKILDTKTGKKITFKNLETYINPKNTGKTYAQVIRPYNQKWFVNETSGLRTEINSKLIKNWTPARKDTFFEIQHNAGRYTDPFDVSLTNESLNLKESQVKTKFEKMWNASNNLSDKKKAFRWYKENLPKEILSKPSMVKRSRYFGTDIPFDEQLRELKAKGVNLARGTLKKALELSKIVKTTKDPQQLENIKKLLKSKVKNLNAVDKKLFMKIIGPAFWGWIGDISLQEMAHGKPSGETFYSLAGLGGAWRKGKKRLISSEEENQVYDRNRILRLYENAKDGSSGMRSNLMSIVVNAAKNDSDFKGQPGEYIEWLKFKVREPNQMTLALEREQKTEERLQVTEEQKAAAERRYQAWSQFLPVRTVKEMFKMATQSDEEKEKEKTETLESLLNV